MLSCDGSGTDHQIQTAKNKGNGAPVQLYLTSTFSFVGKLQNSDISET